MGSRIKVEIRLTETYVVVEVEVMVSLTIQYLIIGIISLSLVYSVGRRAVHNPFVTGDGRAAPK